MKRIILALLIVVLVFVSGCGQNSSMQSSSEKAEDVSA